MEVSRFGKMIPRLFLSFLLIALTILCACSSQIEAGATNTGEISADNLAATSMVSGSQGLESDPRSVNEIVKEMSLREKVSQMFIVGREDLFVPGTMDYQTEYPYGGVIYYFPDMSYDVGELTSWTNSDLRSNENIPLFVSLDEEGGNVSRVSGNLDNDGPSSMPIGDSSPLYSMFSYKDQGEEVAFDNAKSLAGDISRLGFNFNFAPVADISANQYSSVVQEGRCYSDDYGEGATLVAAAVKGFHAEKNEDGRSAIACTAKHFPGLGSAYGNTHRYLAYIDKTKDDLKSEDIVPFQAAIDAGVDAVMLGHVVAEDVDSEPASMSEKWVSVLRNEMGFDGIVITDSMSMNSMGDDDPCILAGKSILSGADIVLCASDPGSAVEYVESMVLAGEISEESIDQSVERILSVKRSIGLL